VPVSWARLDDDANDSEKLVALSDAAWRMYGCGLIHCNRKLTDGFIAAAKIHTFGVKAKNKEAVADELCRSLVPGKGPLWEKVDGGYRVHDYLDWNDSRDKVLKQRAGAKKRLDKFRRRHDDEPAEDAKPAVLNTARNAFHAVFRTVGEAVFGTALPRTTYQKDQKKQEQPLRGGTCVKAVENSETARIVNFHRRQRSRQTDDGKPAIRVIAALARHILIESPDIDENELMERVKVECARCNLEYSQAVGPAIDRARAQLVKRRA
jgi:hypothetical protein